MTSKEISKEDFMAFFRDDEKLGQLSVEERVELFSYALVGSSDFTKPLLNSVLSDYGVDWLEVMETKNKPIKQAKRQQEHILELVFGKDLVKKFLNGEVFTKLEKQINVKQYTFPTNLEKVAFLRGMEEALGWEEYWVVTRAK